MFLKGRNKERSPSIRTAEEFESVFYKYHQQVYRIVRNQTGSKEVAEEILHEIFSSLWERRNSLTIKEPIEHYLNRAAKLKVINYFRDEARRKKHLQRATEDFPYAENYTEQAVNYRELRSLVTEATDRLPELFREVYRLRLDHGMSNQEIASSLLISVKTVEYRMKKAVALVREKLRFK
ncbi:MAG: RNA polymerase sigma-70 factor [Cyclobacteriaceae bacterium]